MKDFFFFTFRSDKNSKTFSGKKSYKTSPKLSLLNKNVVQEMMFLIVDDDDDNVCEKGFALLRNALVATCRQTTKCIILLN